LAGSISQANAIKQQGSFQAARDNINAGWAGIQGNQALLAGAREAAVKQFQIRQQLGAQRAAAAANGVAPDSGSAMNAQVFTAGVGAADVKQIQNNAAMQSLGFQAQGADYQTQAALARISSGFNARSTILSGGLNAARDIQTGVYYQNRFATPPPASRYDNNYFGG
jgi:hypothetical protein